MKYRNDHENCFINLPQCKIYRKSLLLRIEARNFYIAKYKSRFQEMDFLENGKLIWVKIDTYVYSVSFYRPLKLSSYVGLFMCGIKC